METDKNYFMVGVFVLATMLAFIGFSLWLAGPRDDSKYTFYHIRFAESVSGLSVGSPVKFRGVDVGKVRGIMIDAHDTRLIRVDVAVLKTTPIKTDTVAGLNLQGITGTVYIELSGSNPDAPDLPGAPVRSDDTDTAEIPAKPSSINAIINRTPEILAKVSVIADQVTKLFSDKNIAAFGDTLEKFQEVSGDLHNVIEGSQGDIRKMAENLNRTSQQLSALLAHTNDTAGGQYQQFYQLLNELKATSRDVGQLTNSLKEDPSRIFVPSQQKGIPAP
jgi:phospholipid/cholesterol/gamma-HCH transport system substrate-binding protein